MGESISLPCSAEKDYVPVPRYHFKCRYDKADPYSASTPIFTRTTDVYRFKVPRDKIKWSEDYPGYTPVNFTSDKIKTKDASAYKDPDVDSPDFKKLKFNQIDKSFKCDRSSHHGPYELMYANLNTRLLVPCNPVGRTGLIGRGHLGRWGPNHAADPIVSQWKRDQTGQVVRDSVTGKPILQFVAIQRRDTKEWAIPGGMVDPGEKVTKTLIREFSEEALSKNFTFDKSNSIAVRNTFEQKLREFFKGGILIYKGYVDDPRNTDNSWMETLACNFHDEYSNIVGVFQLCGGDDAENARWMDMNSDLELFASHTDFLRAVATIHKAHW